MKKILYSKEDAQLVERFNWGVATTGYARCTKAGYRIMMHRLIMNANPDQIVDHINQNKIDNRRENLRFVNRSQNAINSKTVWSNSKTGVKGVSFRKGRGLYEAYITRNGKTVKLGYFKTLEQAKTARQGAE